MAMNAHIQYLDGIPIRLREPFDFEFVHQYGAVFKVFDDQDSGNICFGVTAADGKRYFVKFAGALAHQYAGLASDAVESLRQVVPIYEDLAHPSLIRLVRADEIGGGFAVVFDWVDAICAHPMFEDDHRRFRALPMDVHRQVFKDVLQFHIQVAARGYVTIDFYDGSIMWDEQHQQTVICDIDFYEKAPCLGRHDMWGSPRFASPEERVDGAVVDEVTNVYTMGATAFCLFADSDRSRDAWPLGDELYDVVKRATSEDRTRRQQSIQQLLDEWDSKLSLRSRQRPIDTCPAQICLAGIGGVYHAIKQPPGVNANPA